jgi:hypothetical protein
LQKTDEGGQAQSGSFFRALAASGEPGTRRTIQRGGQCQAACAAEKSRVNFIGFYRFHCEKSPLFPVSSASEFDQCLDFDETHNAINCLIEQDDVSDVHNIVDIPAPNIDMPSPLHG